MRLATGVYKFPRQDRLYFGDPAETVLSGLAGTRGWKQVLIVTSKSMAQNAVTQQIRDALKDRVVSVYSGITAHSPRTSVLEGTRLAREAKVDCLLAIGGGSVMDSAKAIMACLRHGVSTEEGLQEVIRDTLKLTSEFEGIDLVAVPSTLSAAEFTTVAGISDPKDGTKSGIFRDWIVPGFVVLDPRATLETPEWLFTTTGIRSIDHAVEGLLSSNPSPYADPLAREGLRRLAGSLKKVRAEPSNLAARLDCQLGSWLTISSFVGGVPYGASHAISRVLGAGFDIPHGVTSCITLPPVLDWNSTVDDGRQKEIVELLGADPGTTASAAVSALLADLGQEHRLGEFGITPNDYESIAEMTMGMLKIVWGNPRPISSPAEVVEILRKAQ